MNRLSLERVVFDPVAGMEAISRAEEMVVPIIDGTPLHEMVDDREEGLGISIVAPPSREWLGTPAYGQAGRAVVLDGSCGIAECCGVYARITLTDDRVIWSDFRARGQPPIPAGLHFEFDRSQYEVVIENVTSAPERRQPSPDPTDE